MSGTEFEEGNPDVGVHETGATYRTRRDRKRTPDRKERNPLVEMPSTPLFQASSTTAAAALAKIGEATGGTISFLPGGDGPWVETEAATATPVFVVGGAQRDRDLLRAGLGSHANVSVTPESDVLVDMARALDASLGSLAGLGYPDQYWFKMVGERFAASQSERAEAEGKRRWVEFVDAADLPLGSLDRLFPRALVVRVVGRGWSPLGARSARRAASRLSGGRYLEIHSADLKTNPAGACRAILAFMGEADGSTGNPSPAA